MGLFVSYCKKCNSTIGWFGLTKGIMCDKCKYLNTYDELFKSLYNEDYWKENLIAERKEKLNKLNKNDGRINTG